MASQWIHQEARRVIGQVRTLFEAKIEGLVYLHYCRGQLVASRELDLEGYALATRLALPRDKTDDELLEWILFECKSVPCHPEK